MRGCSRLLCHYCNSRGTVWHNVLWLTLPYHLVFRWPDYHDYVGEGGVLVQPLVENKKKFNWYRIVAFWCLKAVGAEGQCLPPLSFPSFQAMLESFKAVGDPTACVDLQSRVVV